MLYTGTEEGFTDDPTVFYGSTHGRDHFPGTGTDPSPFVGDKALTEVDRRIVKDRVLAHFRDIKPLTQADPR